MELRLDIQPDIHYEGDGRLLEKVFSNVIGNAVAYLANGVHRYRFFARWCILCGKPPAFTLPRKI